MSLLLLVCSLLPVSLDSPPPTTQGAVVEVRRGRAVLLAGGVERTVRPDKPQTADGKAHLEVGAGTEVQVNWPGRASMHLWGPASVEWSPDGKPSRDPMENTFTTHGVTLRFMDLAWADLEIRRGVHTLHLPGSWRASVESGAFYLRGLPTGPTEIRHHAGSPVSLEWIGDPSRARPPVRVYPGSSVVLERPDTGTGRRQSKAEQAWERPSWPWRQSVDSDEQVAMERQAGAEEWQSREARRGGLARVREFDDQPVRVEVQPMEIERMQPEPVQPVREPAILPSQTEPHVDSAPADVYRFQRDQWHGVDRSELTLAGQVVIQRASGVDVRVFPSGRRKVFLDSTAPGPIWCFGAGTDYLLHPGAVAVFETNGNLRMKFGTIEVMPAPAGRPEFADLQ
jgi:hypothetical protein